MPRVQTRSVRAASGTMWGCLIVAIGFPGLCVSSAETLEVGRFSQAEPGNGFPDGWKPLTFTKVTRPTTYVLVRDPDRGTVVVRAVSERSASGLVREITIDPKDYPVVEWRWKVSNVLQGGDVTKKDGDDYPARLYITFQYDSSKVGFFEKIKYETVKLLYGRYPPLEAINYIWESKEPIGTVRPNPYSDRVIMFVVESGEEKLDTWVRERRNVYEDYKRAFGGVPPLISGVAIMTDTDNTEESATAYFGDIAFHRARAR